MKVLVISSKDECPCEEGTIFRLLGCNRRHDYDDFTIGLEVLGYPPEGASNPPVMFLPE